MRPYTFNVRINAHPNEGREMSFGDDASAIEGARTILQASIDFRAPVEEPAIQAVIGVGRGSLINGPEVVWLGEWEWADTEEDWCWTASPTRPD